MTFFQFFFQKRTHQSRAPEISQKFQYYFLAYEPRRARLEYFYYLIGGLRPRNLDWKGADMTDFYMQTTHIKSMHV